MQQVISPRKQMEIYKEKQTDYTVYNMTYNISLAISPTA